MPHCAPDDEGALASCEPPPEWLTVSETSDKLSDMATVTLREAQRNLSALLNRIERGEEIAITRRGHVIAKLVPAADDRRVEWPDFEARIAARFPDGAPGVPTSDIVDEQREERV